MAKDSFYDLHMNSIEGDEIRFSDFKGKKVIIINTASECGFTSQYAQIEELASTFKNLVVLAIPSNDFGGQEPGSHDQIKDFCQTNYGSSFMLTEKVNVLGKERHDIFSWLQQKDLNGSYDAVISWNFYKFFIDEQGVISFYRPSDYALMSEDVLSWIES